MAVTEGKSEADGRGGGRDGGRVVVITGASAGIGRAITREFAQRGDRLALLARGAAGLDAARNEALALGAREALALEVDLGDADQVEAAARQVDDQLGPVDVWVNNAMNSVFAPTWEITPAEFRRVTEVTYLGAVYGTLAALERMRPRDRGTIVIVGSALAYRGIPLQAAYCGAKHALKGFRDSLRADLLSEGSNVQVTTVNLPAVNTPQFQWVRTRLPRHPQPVPPIYQPELAASAVLWATEHTPRELDVGKPTVLTRLGNKIAPGLLDHYLARTGREGQQTDEEIDRSSWKDNLDQPVDADRDFGAHGRFDDDAKGSSPQYWLRTHRPHVAAAAAAATLAGLLTARRST